jgi:ATP-binding cassette subfamily C (CFTR/MRP) protein 1
MLASRSALFPKTIRFNVDPLGLASNDQAIRDALQAVGMWTLLEERGGLESEFAPGSLSHGEQQLLVLARAILRQRTHPERRSILILDEATSSVDFTTEDKIHEIIQKDFSNNTTIMVAHRLDLLRDSNLVVELSNGKVINIGLPGDIL